MTFEHTTKIITGDSPGRETAIHYYTIGPDDAPKKVYMQAALHGDEQPGILILHHLLEMLREADERGELNARFVLFPMVNPLGMGNIMFHQHQGRYDYVSGVNQNRQWPDLYEAIHRENTILPRDDAAENTAYIRDLVKKWLDNRQSMDAPNARMNALSQQRQIIMEQAYDADYVFDVHCDDESLLHIFTLPQLMPGLQPLADWTGAAATLTAEDSGGGSFDEVWSTLWTRLANDYPDHPFDLCYSMTMEYRGRFDTFDDLNRQDAHNLIGYFQSEGLIAANPGARGNAKPQPAPEPQDLAATQMLRVDQSGLLAYQVGLGDYVKKGEVVAELIALDGENAFSERTPILSGTDGIVISRNSQKYVWPGCSIAKIVGKEILPDRGEYLLED